MTTAAPHTAPLAPKAAPVRAGRVDGRRRSSWRVTEAVALGGLALWVAVLLVATWGTWGDPTMDTGYDLLAASRTAHGELPYLDYVYSYGPVAPLLLAAVYAVTGVAMWPAFALGVVLSLVVIGLTYRVGRLVLEPLAAALAAALVATLAFTSANNSYVMPHTTSAPLVTALVLGAVLCLAPSAAGVMRPRAAVGGGVLLGVAAITRLEVAVPVDVAVLVWFALVAWRSPADRAAVRATVRRTVPAALGIPLVVYGVLITQISPHELLYDNLYPRSLFDAGGHWLIDAEMPLTVSSFAALVGRLAAYAAATVVLTATAIVTTRPNPAGRIARTALAVVVVAALTIVLADPEAARAKLKYAYLWVPAGAAVASIVLLWRSGRVSRTGSERTALLMAVILTGVTVKGYASFDAYPNAKFPARASVYLLPLAAPLLAYLHTRVLPALVSPRDPRAAAAIRAAGLGWLAVLAVIGLTLTVRDAHAERDTISGPHGSLTARASQGPALQGALDAIGRYTRPGDPILVAPQLTSLYVLSGRDDPLPQLSLLPGALADDAAQERAVAAMARVRLAVVDRTPLHPYHHGAFGVSFDQRLAAWLHSNFRLLRTVKGDGSKPRLIDIWIRTSS